MGTTLDDIIEKIRAFIASEARVPEGDDAFTSDVHLFDAGYLDSLRLVTLLAFIEATFQVELGEGALFSEQFTTIRGIAKLVHAARLEVAPRKPERPQRHPCIRPFVAADLPAVTRLYEFVERSGTRNPARGLEAYFRRILLDQPHGDSDLPSHVYEEDGSIEGFIGTHVRRLLFRGRLVRVACAGQIVVEPRSRHKAVGLHLLKEFLSGPQDLAMTDGATLDVLHMWEQFGGRPRAVGNVRWTRLFRPWRFAVDLLTRRNGTAGRLLKPLGLLGAPLLDSLTRPVAGMRLRGPASPPLRAEELTPEAMVEGLHVLSSVSLLPAYDRDYLRWLFFELGKVRSRGQLRRVLLREPSGSVAGWYLYYLARDGVCQVLQVAAPRSHAKAVLAHMFHDADRAGAAVLQGRVEPDLLAPLSQMGVSLQHTWSYAMAYTRDPELAAAVHGGDALLTRLDGEWWCGFQHEPLDEPRPLPSERVKAAGVAA